MASLQIYNHQLDYIGFSRTGSDRITAPAVFGFFSDGKIESDELARREIKNFYFRNFYMEYTGERGYFLNIDYSAGEPFFGHNICCNPVIFYGVAFSYKGKFFMYLFTSFLTAFIF